MPSRRLFVVPALLLATAVPAEAWNDFGHEVVASIAWLELDAETRSRVLELFRQAPDDSLMDCLDLTRESRRGCGRFAYRTAPVSAPGADRLLFERAAYWPDLARDLEEYNRPAWHYIGWSWVQEEGGGHRDSGIPEAVPNAVSQLRELALSVADSSGRADKRAIHLAWIFHLVGDVHQPLHAASRVTSRPDERQGDRGGNGFALDEWNRNLHAFWDGALDGVNRVRYRDEAYARLGGGPDSRGAAPIRDERFWRAYGEARDGGYEADKEKVVAEARRLLSPEEAVSGDFASGDFEAWARESNGITRASLYPPELVRGKAPPEGYAEMAYQVSLRRAAMAGYRLADLLRSLLGD